MPLLMDVVIHQILFTYTVKNVEVRVVGILIVRPLIVIG
jgi:hypothetical protein